MSGLCSLVSRDGRRCAPSAAACLLIVVCLGAALRAQCQGPLIEQKLQDGGVLVLSIPSVFTS